jgi:hypothetical protein
MAQRLEEILYRKHPLAFLVFYIHVLSVDVAILARLHCLPNLPARYAALSSMPQLHEHRYSLVAQSHHIFYSKPSSRNSPPDILVRRMNHLKPMPVLANIISRRDVWIVTMLHAIFVMPYASGHQRRSLSAIREYLARKAILFAVRADYSLFSHRFPLSKN